MGSEMCIRDSIQRNCHKGRSPGSAQSANGDSVRGGRQSERGRGKGRGRGSHGRGGRGGNQAAAGEGASAVASSAATLGGSLRDNTSSKERTYRARGQ